jgi:hypothetical protein
LLVIEQAEEVFERRLNQVDRRNHRLEPGSHRVKIDERVAHYRRIASNVTDKLTLDRIEELIFKLDTEKAALHPDK